MDRGRGDQVGSEGSSGYISSSSYSLDNTLTEHFSADSSRRNGSIGRFGSGRG